MPTLTLEQRCRARALGYLNRETAFAAGLGGDVAALQQFCAGQVTLDDSSLRALARHMGLSERPKAGVKQAAA
jgi:hypothetical protein